MRVSVCVGPQTSVSPPTTLSYSWRASSTCNHKQSVKIGPSNHKRRQIACALTWSMSSSRLARLFCAIKVSDDDAPSVAVRPAMTCSYSFFDFERSPRSASRSARLQAQALYQKKGQHNTCNHVFCVSYLSCARSVCACCGPRTPMKPPIAFSNSPRAAASDPSPISTTATTSNPSETIQASKAKGGRL